ncbi:unnamed protein product [Miscanthus lutarioriparius]|uniref:BSD domain-containing protein n=1 Tax=Miscanthus lutarioriparius TaxID=422564 RepID=A0A811SGJ8_9POAL|nr:unnamed protein product [Miscanthus lutarioriparius]
MARGLRGVRDDLSELGRHLLDIACFLHPLLNPAHTDSPPPTPTGPAPPAARAAPHSVISDIQRDHMESIEKLVPDLASLRGRLCPSYMDEDIFWKIYFRLLESNIIEHSSEEDTQSVPNSVHHNNEIESDSPPHVCEIESVKSNQEGYQSSDGRALPKTRSERSIDQWVFAKSKSEESMDQWSEIPSDVESYREGKRYLSSEELSDVDSANVVVMDKYMDSLLSDRRHLPYASSSVRQDSVRRKPASSSHRPPQPTPPVSLSKKESWDVIEDSEFDILDS